MALKKYVTNDVQSLRYVEAYVTTSNKECSSEPNRARADEKFNEAKLSWGILDAGSVESDTVGIRCTRFLNKMCWLSLFYETSGRLSSIFKLCGRIQVSEMRRVTGVFYRLEFCEDIFFLFDL